MNLRDQLDDPEQAWSDEAKIELLLVYLETHAPRRARHECERFIRHCARESSAGFHLEKTLKEEAAHRTIVRACNLVAAHRLDLSSLGHDDLDRLILVIQYLEGQIRSAKSRWRRGLL